MAGQAPPFTSGPGHSSPRECFSCQECWGCRGRLPSLILTLVADGAGENLAQGCVVPGVTSTYRRILDTSQGCSLGSWEGDGEVKGLRGQVPLLKLASRDSGVEMAVGDGSLTASPGLSEESLDLELVGGCEPLALPVEPPAHLGRLLASQKLEQVLERSSQLPTSPASLSQHRRSPKPTRKPEYKVPLFGARDQEATKAETDQEAGPEEAEVVSANSWLGKEWVDMALSHWGWWGPPVVLPRALSWGGAFLSLIDGCVPASCLTLLPAMWK